MIVPRTAYVRTVQVSRLLLECPHLCIVRFFVFPLHSTLHACSVPFSLILAAFQVLLSFFLFLLPYDPRNLFFLFIRLTPSLSSHGFAWDIYSIW